MRGLSQEQRMQHVQSEVGFDLRLRLEVERKRAIARVAAAMVGEGEAVALDASTTAYYLALELRTKRELVVVTNGLVVATALADAPGITVLVTGGLLRLSAMSLVGDLGTDVLRTTRINKGFLGARGDGGAPLPERARADARNAELGRAPPLPGRARRPACGVARSRLGGLGRR